MGGRGSIGKNGSGNKGRSGSGELFSVPKITKNVAKGLSRKDLETFATAIFANRAMKSGMSREEGIRRAKSLMSGNTTAQLKNYVIKNS